MLLHLTDGVISNKHLYNFKFPKGYIIATTAKLQQGWPTEPIPRLVIIDHFLSKIFM